MCGSVDAMWILFGCPAAYYSIRCAELQPPWPKFPPLYRNTYLDLVQVAPEQSGIYRWAVIDLPHQATFGEKAKQKLNRSMADSTGRSEPSNTNWTVYSPNVTRGNLGGDLDSRDPRTSVGWNADATAAHRSEALEPWVSTTQQQSAPANDGSWGWSTKDDEACVQLQYRPQVETP